MRSHFNTGSTRQIADEALMRSRGAGSANAEALQQAAWFIDPVHGNDSNNGLTPSTAVKHFAEINRRWNGGIVMPPLRTEGPIQQRFCDITIVGTADLPVTDPLTVNPGIVLGPEVSIRFFGAPAQTIFTSNPAGFTAVTTKDRDTNTPWQITDSNLPDAAFWSGFVNGRLRITSGPRAGAIAYVAKDLGAKTARMSEFIIPQKPPLTMLTTDHVTPTVGDEYVIETITGLYMGALQANPEGTESLTPPANICFENIRFLDAGASTFATDFQGGLLMVVTACDFNAFCFVGGNVIIFLEHCNGISGITTEGGSVSQIDAGLWSNFLASFVGEPTIDNDTIFQSCGVAIFEGCDCMINQCGIFDAPPTDLYNPTGYGLFLRPGASAFNNPSLPNSNLWGSGNMDAGLGVANGATFVFLINSVPSITGTTGDFALGGETTGFAFDSATHAFTTGRSTTWANIATSIAGGGFGGSALRPDHAASVVAD